MKDKILFLTLILLIPALLVILFAWGVIDSNNNQFVISNGLGKVCYNCISEVIGVDHKHKTYQRYTVDSIASDQRITSFRTLYGEAGLYLLNKRNLTLTEYIPAESEYQVIRRGVEEGNKSLSPYKQVQVTVKWVSLVFVVALLVFVVAMVACIIEIRREIKRDLKKRKRDS